jgi:hypothetical protein
MRFGIWLLVLLAPMRTFVLFASMSAAGGLRVPVEWIDLALPVGAAIFAGWEARRDIHDRLDCPAPPHRAAARHLTRA